MHVHFTRVIDPLVLQATSASPTLMCGECVSTHSTIISLDRALTMGELNLLYSSEIRLAL